MKDISLAVLEGLIHNIRTPLNLIMGYTQQLQKQSDNPYLARIYQATVKIDDMMQGTWAALEQRNPNVERVCLNEWMQSELNLLNNYLQIKHHIIIHSRIPDVEVHAEISSLQLCNWLETLLLTVINNHNEAPINLQMNLAEDACMKLDFVDMLPGGLAMEAMGACFKGTELLFAEYKMNKKGLGVEIEVKFR